MTSLGFVTIGQSPRLDIVESMLPLFDRERINERGALDGLSRATIEALQPSPGETPLVTRLVDGTEVLVSKARLMPHLQRAVDEVVRAGAAVVVVLCTGAFPDLRTSTLTILPDAVLQANVDAVLSCGRLGVVMPNDGQMDMMQRKWERPGRTILGLAASPYASGDDLSSIGKKLSRDGADMIVLDCMGYTSEMKRSVAASSNVPVILANRIVGRVIEELVAN